MLKIKSIKNLLALFAFTALSITPVKADSLTKHPRVAELEDKLRVEASSYLRARFPDQPYLVNVSVDPIHRFSKENAKGEQETLPYFDSSEQEINDEWDDPNLSLNQLLLRTKKVAVEVSLPENVSDVDQAEVKDALYRSLHLVPARDDISISRRKWASNKTVNYIALFGGAGILFFLIGLAVVQRFGYKKLASSISALQLSGSSSGSSFSAPSPVEPSHFQSSKGFSGDVNISDPIKTRELIHAYSAQAKTLSVFPTLEAMIILDDYAKRSPENFGALLQEISPDLREKIFKQGPGSHWYNCMIEAGTLSLESAEVFQKAIKSSQYSVSGSNEQAMISVWRMGDQAADFVRQLGRKTAFELLKGFPQNISIEIARSAFPGNWAEILDSDKKSSPLSESVSQEITVKANAQVELLSFERIAQHRQYVQLIEFLQSSSPEVEKEIYLAVGNDSYLAKNRPPFYAVLENDAHTLAKVVPCFTPTQWAIALFNVNRNQRKNIEELMQEKQKILFVEHLKSLDAANPQAEVVGKFRASIAQKMAQESKGEEKDARAS